ncbi:MAG: UDP-N-acetylmuramoyl-tripeptide--D-alanyl-D-alanine ligase [Gammaproteobacteria bacterium]|nr:UDP-N-acetylmuramoyl-tripeptide--D-alanyl-D-alanine ligase [Gammaproteobacteria bacterium]
MIALSLSQCARPLQAELYGEDVSFSAVSTDTRNLAAGDLFVALKGPRFDGHAYLQQARERGAVAAMVSDAPATGMPSLLLQDTRVGLGRLAALWRERSAVPLIGVTGSNGKTTVKEMIAAILGQRHRVLATRGNLNNNIGLPLTLLRLQAHDCAVVEMGANHSGEIGYLSRIAQPDVALLINAGRAHLEGFGSLRGVAEAKCEIIDGLKPGGCFIFNNDDPWAPLWRRRAAGLRTLGFGCGEGAEIRSPAQSLHLHWREGCFFSRFQVVTPAGENEIELALAGAHNRMNALAAIAAAQQLGAGWEEIRAGLAAIRPVPGRLQPLAGQVGCGVIDDSYNANPDSVVAAVDVLASAPGRRYLVLGELREMGAGGGDLYRELGEYAHRSGIEGLLTLGDPVATAAAAFGTGGEHYATLDALLERLAGLLQAGDQVLVKGSRAAAMERVVKSLTGEVV